MTAALPDLVDGGRRPCWSPEFQLAQSLCHRSGLQQCDDLIIELIAIYRRNEIDQAALGTPGVEARNQMTNFNRQNS